jgi:2-polyprenyl-3-methyl-5-hydroxy-6-metoxy-1,4-benzoquinol methylase
MCPGPASLALILDIPVGDSVGAIEMLRLARKKIKSVLDLYPKWICRREFESQAFTRFNERPIEFSFVFRNLGAIYPRTILDVGSGTTALPHLMRTCGFLVTAMDNVHDYWPSGMVNRHYHVIDDDITAPRLAATFDLITCISVLEHVEKPDDAVRSMFSLLNPGGHLILTCPYTERSYVRNVYELAGSSYGQGAPYITQSYSRRELQRWLKENSGTIVSQEYWQFWEGDHWTVGRQVLPPRIVTSDDKHQLTCVLIGKGS